MNKKRKKTNIPTIIAVCALAAVLFMMVPFVGDWIIDSYIYPTQGQTEGTSPSTLPSQGETIASTPATEATTPTTEATIPDTQAPVITGAKNLEVYVGNSVSYRNGVTVSDNLDSAPTLTVDSSSVDLSTAGTYSVTYTAIDAAGNKATVTITVTVREKPDNYVDPEIIYQRVDGILAQFIREDMTDREKAEAVYVWTRRDVHLTYGSAPKRDDYLQTAYEFLDTRKGDCFYFFAIQKLMLERLGIPTIDLKKVKALEDDSNHYWLLVSVDSGQTYYHYDNVWSKNLCLVTDAELDTFSSWVDSNPFNRDKSLYPATPTEKLPEGALPWDDPSILAATP